MNESGAVFGTLALVLICLIGVMILVRRFAPHWGQRLQLTSRLQHLGLLSLTPQCSVALIQIGPEILVLGVTPHTVTLLTKANTGAGLVETERKEVMSTGSSERDDRVSVLSQNPGAAR